MLELKGATVVLVMWYLQCCVGITGRNIRVIAHSVGWLKLLGVPWCTMAPPGVVGGWSAVADGFPVVATVGGISCRSGQGELLDHLVMHKTLQALGQCSQGGV